MVTVYLICAAAGSTVLVCQLVLMVVGIGGEHDVGGHDFDAGDHDIGGGHDVDGHDAGHHDSSYFFKILSFRALVAAVAFFGIGGMIGHTGGMPAYTTFLCALTLGCAAMLLVAWILRLLRNLNSEGNVHIELAVGAPGSVYLSVPGHQEGRGKVTVRTQGRTVEYQAITQGETLATGTPVVVMRVIGNDTVEVVPESGEEDNDV